MTEPNSIETVQQIAAGYILPRCLHVVADLGVADVLDETPRSASDLAACVGAHPNALGRVLRLLAAHGVFEVQGDMVCHSPTSRLLRTDHPQSMRAFARMFGLPVYWTTYEAMEHSLRTGLPATAKVLPQGFWGYFAQHPQESGVFNAAMAAKAQGQVAGIIAAYDFSGFGVVGDIGGGSGHLLRAVLDAAPATRGVLFDVPHVIEEAAGLASGRLTLHAGDFFHDALPCCDAYLLMDVIHDWGDAEAVAILQAIRRAAPAHATLLAIERLVSTDAGSDWAKVLDVHMLTMLGGRQRTLAEYEALFQQAGFALQRRIDTRSGTSILVARTAVAPDVGRP